MEYARISAADLEKADIRLPADATANNRILKGSPAGTKFYMGTPMWGRKEWVGNLYPKGLKASQFLGEYAKRYNAVELNATHYTLYQPEEINKWVAQSNNPNFKFCPKFWNEISHRSGFANTKETTVEFLKSVRAFGQQVGPVFLQVSESYSPKNKQQLYDYLQSLPSDLQFFLEVRHPDWFGKEKEYLIEKLHSLNIGIVITDALAHRAVVHMALTVPKTIIRFTCLGDHWTDALRIDAWANRLKYWQENGMQECYFFVHVSKESLSPQITKYVAEQFNKVCHAGLPEVRFANNLLF